MLKTYGLLQWVRTPCYYPISYIFILFCMIYRDKETHLKIFFYSILFFQSSILFRLYFLEKSQFNLILEQN